MRPFPDPSILLHPQIPKPLHLLNPRTILGKEWWDKNRQIAYLKYVFCCHACGINKYDAKYYQWLEAHEMYDIDYTTGKVEFVELVALCYSCHNFIHSGRMERLVATGKIDAGIFSDIMSHGHRVLEEAGILDNRPQELKALRDSGQMCSWEDWHLVIDGVNYGQRFKSMEEWEQYWVQK